LGGGKGKDSGTVRKRSQRKVVVRGTNPHRRGLSCFTVRREVTKKTQGGIHPPGAKRKPRVAGGKKAVFYIKKVVRTCVVDTYLEVGFWEDESPKKNGGGRQMWSLIDTKRRGVGRKRKFGKKGKKDSPQWIKMDWS